MATRQRPLSPHLQVYRWQIQMMTSIIHRATGIILTVGALLIAAAMLAMATGPEAWDCVRRLAGSWLGLAVLFGWTWAFAYHLLNGIRHLAQDAGFGFSIPAFIRNGWLSVIGSLVLTGVIWSAVAARGGWL
ncbi:succinate dehydrogenase, cytochrome b556 subunit [Pseudoxanthomonas gei]|uniref:Succinate dehydrogenase cytochrome b556 subunit n=1 Tax=Pseudoxanthomonas gei TaxID=1383030 RepID=A0ABX0AEA8_9GAMM|nr:succinate dehydrogenase, cytochrome b556 subunit [Pseudoxanthomonas gei]NDK38581.1 succinate dehydrogenase, cytochrome b556 subunit [Pseudoxanthomonas gei]